MFRQNRFFREKLLRFIMINMDRRAQLLKLWKSVVGGHRQLHKHKTLLNLSLHCVHCGDPLPCNLLMDCLAGGGDNRRLHPCRGGDGEAGTWHPLRGEWRHTADRRAWRVSNTPCGDWNLFVTTNIRIKYKYKVKPNDGVCAFSKLGDWEMLS